VKLGTGGWRRLPVPATLLGPSNPVSSIGPILGLDGVRDLVRDVRRRIAVCPVVLGAGPAEDWPG
jgi:2-phospho-L-lactate transferase/gluconeogenesis factor (CofD/UPF0052 family)